MSFGDYHGTPRRLVGHFRPSYNLKRNLSLIYKLPNGKIEIGIEAEADRIQELSRLLLEPLFDANRRRLNRCSRHTRPPRPRLLHQYTQYKWQTDVRKHQSAIHIHIAVGMIALHQPAQGDVDGLVEVVGDVHELGVERANHTGVHHRTVKPVE